MKEINSLTDQEQADELVNHFSKIRCQFNELQTCDIKIPSFDQNSIPQLPQLQVENELKHIKTKKIHTTRRYPSASFEIFCSKVFRSNHANSQHKHKAWDLATSMEKIRCNTCSKSLSTENKAESKKHKQSGHIKQN